MKTDPISAATAYQVALEHIMKAKTLHEARQHAAKALEITFAAPSYDEIGVDSGLGGSTGTPFVSISVSNSVIQVPSTQARQVALQLLEAAAAAESDGFVLSWLGGEPELSPAQRAALLQDFRADRARLRNAAG